MKLKDFICVVLVMLFLLGVKLAHASEDQWLCKEESSQLRGNVLAACGVGLGTTEDDARALAFRAAQDEFSRVCDLSEHCHFHKIDVEPKRTSCESIGSSTKCYRLVLFTISQDFDNQEPFTANIKTLDGSTVAIFAGNDPFLPIKVGMRRKAVLKAFGKPYEVHTFDSASSLVYKDEMCSPGFSTCEVRLLNNIVTDVLGIKHRYLTFD